MEKEKAAWWQKHHADNWRPLPNIILMVFLSLGGGSEVRLISVCDLFNSVPIDREWPSIQPYPPLSWHCDVYYWQWCDVVTLFICIILLTLPLLIDPDVKIWWWGRHIVDMALPPSSWGRRKCGLCDPTFKHILLPIVQYVMTPNVWLVVCWEEWLYTCHEWSGSIPFPNPWASYGEIPCEWVGIPRHGVPCLYLEALMDMVVNADPILSEVIGQEAWLANW